MYLIYEFILNTKDYMVHEYTRYIQHIYIIVAMMANDNMIHETGKTCLN